EPRVPAHFTSIRAAVAFIQAHVHVPVKVPSPLPPKLRLATRHPVYLGTGEGEIPKAQLDLARGARKHLIIEYGTAVFDGCGGDEARAVRVAGGPAMLNSSHEPSGPWSEVIWPATPHHLLGRYGLTGNFSGPEI